MSVPTLELPNGMLPLGRYSCSSDEIYNYFVRGLDFFGSTTRPQIWNDWITVRDGLRQILPVYTAWISGSFVSSKLDPDDMDIVFTVDGTAYDSLPVGMFARQAVDSLSRGRHFHEQAGKRLDTYIISWYPIPSPGPDMGTHENTYYLSRGHWDDFWQRKRITPKTLAPTQADCIPRRGYLEVKLDDYPG
ncbi:hypothetical protein ABZ345_04365 [Lentzea sp. NPDC005914]|uniref:DUF6932 family protein n=1 Tax=Lentzea sp. NPDC005914 TaxID=3154572 RepID=UPI0033FE3EED